MLVKDLFKVSIDNSWSFTDNDGNYIGDIRLTNTGVEDSTLNTDIYGHSNKKEAQRYMPNIIQKLQNRLSCPVGYFWWNPLFGSQICMFSYKWERDSNLLKRFIQKAFDDEHHIDGMMIGSLNIWYGNDMSFHYECTLSLNGEEEFPLTGVINL